MPDTEGSLAMTWRIVVYTLLWTIEIITVPTSAQSYGELRLAQGASSSPHFTQGRLEVYINGEWGSVCDDFFDLDDANVACRQLGWEGAESYGRSSEEGFGTCNGKIWLDDLECPSRDLKHILWCDHRGVGENNCQHSEDIAIHCYPTPIYDYPHDLHVRLIGGHFPSKGRVEVYCNGKWGTVCDEGGFGDDEANTVCRQLGYTHALAYDRLNMPGREDQPIWLHSFTCDSESDESLLDCTSCPAVGFEGHYDGIRCFHIDDITVECDFDPDMTSLPTEPPSGGNTGSGDVDPVVVFGAVTGVLVLVMSVLIVCCVIGFACLLGNRNISRRCHMRIGHSMHHLSSIQDVHTVTQNGQTSSQSELGTPQLSLTADKSSPTKQMLNLPLTHCVYSSEQTSSTHNVQLPVYSSSSVKRGLSYPQEPPPPYHESEQMELASSYHSSSPVPMVYPDGDSSSYLYDSISRDSIPHDPIAGDSIPHNFISGDSIPHDSIPHVSIPHDSISRDSISIPGDT